MESISEADKKQHKKQKRCVVKMMINNHLVKGREYANQLEALLLLNNNNNHKPFGDDGEEVLTLAQELVNKVVKSFNDSLCEVINTTSSCGSTSSGDQEVKNCQDFDEVVVGHYKPQVKDRRGSYKRRRANDSWVIVSENTEDGYAWRKYGQKKILNTNHPRCYYRCTHKYDQHCRAMKQVQKIDTKDSTMFQTSYISQHTCKDTTKPSQLASIPDPYVLDAIESKLISFQGHTQHVPPYNVNEELEEEEEENQRDDCKSSIDSSIWQDIVVGSTSSESPMEFSSETGSYHHAEVASRTGLEDLDIKTLTRFADFSNLDFSF